MVGGGQRARSRGGGFYGAGRGRVRGGPGRTSLVPGRLARGVPLAGLVMAWVPSTKARARSDSRWLRLRAWSRSRVAARFSAVIEFPGYAPDQLGAILAAVAADAGLVSAAVSCGVAPG
jgi:hypothetical protein